MACPAHHQIQHRRRYQGMPLIGAMNVVDSRRIQLLQQVRSGLWADDRILLPLHHQNPGLFRPAFRQVSAVLKQRQILFKPLAAWRVQILQQ